MTGVMHPRAIAIWTGVLFIVATATSVLALVLSAPVTAVPDIGPALLARPGQLVSSVLMMFASAASIIAIPVVLFPILRRWSEAGALLYFAIRSFESLAYLLGGIFTLGLLRAARVEALIDPDGQLAILKSLGDVSFATGPTLFFGGSAVVLGWLLWRSGLVAAWLSLWKLAGGLLIMVQGVLALFGPLEATTEMMLFMPIALNEMVLALWLIFRGFRPQAVSALGF